MSLRCWKVDGIRWTQTSDRRHRLKWMAVRNAMHPNPEYSEYRIAPEISRKQKKCNSPSTRHAVRTIHIEINVFLFIIYFHWLVLCAFWFYSFIMSFAQTDWTAPTVVTQLLQAVCLNPYVRLGSFAPFWVIVLPSFPAVSTTSNGIQPVRTNVNDAECKWDLTANV